MGRIDEIKETVRRIKQTAMSASDLCDGEYIADTEYLLAKLEIAEKALKEISGVQEASWEYYVDTAYEALEE